MKIHTCIFVRGICIEKMKLKLTLYFKWKKFTQWGNFYPSFLIYIFFGVWKVHCIRKSQRYLHWHNICISRIFPMISFGSVNPKSRIFFLRFHSGASTRSLVFFYDFVRERQLGVSYFYDSVREHQPLSDMYVESEVLLHFHDFLYLLWRTGYPVMEFEVECVINCISFTWGFWSVYERNSIGFSINFLVLEKSWYHVISKV